uniref:Uncharacterized protein n=1 Tax=Plectus sambesii TaxID=2011161 RepID=A0A914WAJ2_9BILA
MDVHLVGLAGNAHSRTPTVEHMWSQQQAIDGGAIWSGRHEQSQQWASGMDKHIRSATPNLNRSQLHQAFTPAPLCTTALDMSLRWERDPLRKVLTPSDKKNNRLQIRLRSLGQTDPMTNSAKILVLRLHFTHTRNTTIEATT